MSSVIPIIIGGGEGGWAFIKFPGEGVVKKRGSPDFRSPEVGISELVLIGLQRTGPCPCWFTY